jgi:hypothetical protein
VVNRVMPALAPKPPWPRKAPAGLRRRIEQNWRDFSALREREQDCLHRLAEMLPAGAMLLCAPELEHEPQTLMDLAELARRISPAL